MIEEYEKTIATMDAELNLNQVALQHTNDLITEKEVELSAVTEHHSATELYLKELHTCVSKLTFQQRYAVSHVT